MDKLVWIAIAFVAGALIPMQGGLNARMGASISSPLHASLISFAVGTLAIGAYVLVTRQGVAWDGVGRAPWYAWLGGFCGAFSLTAIILTFPKLGPGLAFGLVIAGQLVVSLLLEHVDVLVAQPHPITLLRVVGISLVLGGVMLIRSY
jgi:transporter family-2 protein